MAAPQMKLVIDDDVVCSNIVAAPAVRGDTDIVSLTRNYDGPSELIVAVRGWQPAAFDIEAVAQLTVDGIVVFDGLVTPPRMAASPAGETLSEYVIRDRLSIHRGAVNADGSTSFRLDSAPLAQMVTAFMAGAADALAEIGLDAAPAYTGNAHLIACLPVSLENASILDAVQWIAAAAPGVRVFVDPSGGTSRLHFVAIHHAPSVTLTVEQEVVASLAIERSIEDRAGAIRLSERQTAGSSDFTVVATGLSPAWNAADAAAWTLDDWLTVDAAGAETGRSLVFRKWSFAALPANLPPAGAEIIVQAERLVASNLTVWAVVPVVSVDYEARTLITRDPILSAVAPHSAGRRNARVPGTAAAGACRLSYRVTSSGFVTTPGERYPSSGFSGAAYDLAPTLCGYEKAIEIPAGVTDRAGYAAAAHAVHSAVIARGTLGLADEIPSDLLRLRRRINIASTTHDPCGYEELDAPLMGVTFSPRDGLTLDLSTERTLPGGGS